MPLLLNVRRGDDAPDLPHFDWERLARVIETAFEPPCLRGREALRVDVSFVSDAEIAALNRQYRGIAEPTDVLSFPLWEEGGVFSPPEDWADLPLGDVVVAPEYVARNTHGAADYDREIVLVIVHGALHLIGHDHDSEERERAMWALQDRVRDAYFEA